VSQVERRRLKRFVERVGVQFQAGKLRGQGFVRNLSKEGLFVRAERLPEPGVPISICIEMADGHKVELMGSVRWTTAQLPRSREAKPGFGVRLDSDTQAYRELFEALLLQ